MHALRGRPAVALALVITRIALVGGVIPELLRGIDRVLGAQHRKARGRVAASDRPMAGNAGRNIARAIAAAIELLARLPIGWISLQTGARLLREIRPEILHVLLAQSGSHRRHHAAGVDTGLVVEVL